jgi:type IV pilus assembly protein PilY1
MNSKTLSSKLVVYSVLVMHLVSAVAAPTSISTTPVDTSSIVPPNVIFALDDSGSMDMEVLQDSEDGAFWYKPGSSSAEGSFFQSNGKPYFDGGQRYGSLFPNGTGEGARTVNDGTPMYAIPPLPAYAFARSSDYNPIYYNPEVKYLPWAPAYINGNSVSFSQADPKAAKSHPTLSSGTEDLTAVRTSEASNWTFRMMPGMTIPGANVTGIKGKRTRTSSACSSSTTTFSAITSNYRIPTCEYWDVAIPYTPATYWKKETSCPSGATALTCTDAPGGGYLVQYVITDTERLNNFANWFQYYRKRKLMLAGSMGQVLSQLTNIRGGVVQFNNRATVTMRDFSSQDPSKNGQSVLGTIYSNPALGGTPTREALLHVGKQFEENTNIIQFACQRNAAMVLTDGFATNSNVTVPSYDKATYGASRPYADVTPKTLADISLAYYTRNLRPSMMKGQVGYDPSDTSPNADKNRDLHMNTYALTIGGKGTIYGVNEAATANPFVTLPSWPTSYGANEPSALDDLWHATINGRGQMLSARDTSTTVARVQEALTDMLVKAGAQSAVAVSRVNLKAEDTTAYVSSYQVNGWYGDLQAFPINPETGDINSASPAWSAQAKLDSKLPDSRVIVIGDGPSGPVPFREGSLSSGTLAHLKLSTTTNSDAADVIDWLRGVRSKETTTYRTRVHVLGDLVYSEPEVVKGPVAAYLDAGYSTFASSLATRKRVLYQGGNDGMLHAFDAATGAEMWGYIPSFVIPNLSSLASKSYEHQFYVDGTPVAGDVDFGGETWRTILVSGLRAGGAGFFAIDVTSPDADSEDALSKKVLWEFPNASTDSAVRANVGLSFGKPLIAKVAGHGWVVIVSSGYNNTSGDGKGHLFVLNAKTGAVIADIPTSAGTTDNPAGLAQLSAYAEKGQSDATVEAVYGGDLLGNMWRFDLKGAKSTWKAVKLASLVDSSGNAQPITSAPELSKVSTSAGEKRMVFIGTGQLLATSDIQDTKTQSFYALVDNGTATPEITDVRTALDKKPVTVEGTTRRIPGTAVDYTKFKGWYFDLVGAGERITTDSQAAFGAIIFTSNHPSSSACSSASYLYAIGQTTGGEMPSPNNENYLQGAGQQLGQALASRPVVVVTSGQRPRVRAITHLTNNGVVNASPPVSAQTPPRKIAIKSVSR